jgi:hypothetical protein
MELYNKPIAVTESEERGIDMAIRFLTHFMNGQPNKEMRDATIDELKTLQMKLAKARAVSCASHRKAIVYQVLKATPTGVKHVKTVSSYIEVVSDVSLLNSLAKGSPEYYYSTAKETTPAPPKEVDNG